MSRRHDMHYSLLRQLSRNGWRRNRVEHRPDDTAVNEVWELESLWSPRTLRAYLLFRQFPDGYGSRVHVRSQRPESGRELPSWEGVYLGRHWRNAFPTIVAALARWRNQSLNRPASPSPNPAGAAVENQAPPSICTQLEKRLRPLQTQLTERKLRLFACGCLRRFPHLVEDERNLAAVEAGERYADGLIPKREMKKARKAARLFWMPSYEAFDEASAVIRAAAVQLVPQRQRLLASLLDDLTGHLGRPVTLRPSWLRRNGGIAAAVARTIYADHTFTDLPILADALEEAGCDNAALLEHCRTPGEHARGCWVLDLLLGKQ
jgi:hypothetical protein